MQAMWDELKDRTITCIVGGVIGIAEYWQSAWKEGRSAAAAAALPTMPPEIDEIGLMKLYRDKTFMQSRFLNQIKLP